MVDGLTEYLLAPAAEVAPRLLGSTLVRQLDGQCLIGKIVEVEAYDQADAASHSYRGRTPRTEIMFGEPGYLYVYFTYGMHYCCNVVTGPAGQGAAVLIRALEPLAGTAAMADNRRGRAGLEISNGPAKVCQALAIDKALNGHNLRRAPLQLELAAPLPPGHIVQTTRIGIRQAAEVPWRFYIKDNPFVSRP
jgi:DNA-3-methyladenine glycosylase